MKNPIRILGAGFVLPLILLPNLAMATLDAAATNNSRPWHINGCDIEQTVTTTGSLKTATLIVTEALCPSNATEDYSSVSEATATYGSVHASAHAMLLNSEGNFDRARVRSGAAAKFIETLTINSPSRNGTTGMVRFQIHASGTLGVSTDNLQADIRVETQSAFTVELLQAGVSHRLFFTIWKAANDGQEFVDVNLNTSHDPVSIVFGEPFILEVRLSANVDISRRDTDAWQPALTASGMAEFGSTGDITGIAVYDDSGAALSPADYNLVSESGHFTVPTVVSNSPTNWGSLKALYR